MLDVHPPHAPTHTWRDFFIHIATIVIGLLIAVGLEQAVEGIHHKHQRQELRDGVIADSRLMLSDLDQNSLANARNLEDLNLRILQVQQSLALHRTLGPPTYRPALPTNTIRIGNIEAARSSGLMALLSQEEVASLTEPEVGVAHAESIQQHGKEATQKRLAFEQRFQVAYPDGPFDFSAATAAQLDQYLDLLLQERVAHQDLQNYIGIMHRGASAYLAGQRTVEQMRKAQDQAPATPR
jgi:hypothetical protein